jgi:uncharacterized protein with FMN-binding domain
VNTSTKRGVLAAAGTASLIAGIIGAKAGPAGGRLPGALRTSEAAGIAPAATAPAGTPTTGTPTSRTQTSAAPTGATGAATSTPATPAPARPGSGTFTGPAVDVGYGTVQVQVTIAGGRLTDVKALQLPSHRSRSRSISSTAAPILRSEALAAHGANIDGVSGATYTSEGYAQSLQGALDAAHA